MTGLDYEQKYLDIDKDELVTEVTRHKTEGWQLSQACATAVDNGFELIYSMEYGLDMLNLRIRLGADDMLDSVSAVYPHAYLYENEIKDLFGIEIHGMNVDFHGKLYQTALKAPFSTSPKEVT